MTSGMTRRGLFRRTAAGVAGLAGLGAALQNRLYAQNVGFGPLLPDPERVLDLPIGFKYRAISVTGEMMNDGYRVPGAHDGMAAYPGPNGTTLLVRNHEMGVTNVGGSGSPYPHTASYNATARNLIYDPGSASPASGGTTNIIYNTRLKQLEGHFLSLTGTIRNCAGGLTPWNTWLTCEETNLRAGTMSGGTQLEQDHGWVFEVTATTQAGIQTPVPIKSMGRFSHEALSIDPRTGFVYLTEDQGNSAFYRYIPNVSGNLLAGGRLQALKLRNSAIQVTNNRPTPVIQVGMEFDVEWVDLTDVESPGDNLRVQAANNGCAIFSRGEGAWWGNGAIYFVSTDGGLFSLGQIFKYTPSAFEGTEQEVNFPGKLQLFIEPADSSQFAAPDNICIAPSGDVIVCEDGSGDEFVHGVTPGGAVYKIARNALGNGSEFAGACFSPDGTTLFVNIQTPGITLAISGPWHRRVA